MRKAHTSTQRLTLRTGIILDYNNNHHAQHTAKIHKTSKVTVYQWIERWEEARTLLADWEKEYTSGKITTGKYRGHIEGLLADIPRPGAPSTFTEEQKDKIIALSKTEPEDEGVPISHWTNADLALAAKQKGIVSSISSSRVGIFLKRTALKLSKVWYWEHPNLTDWKAFGVSVRQICKLRKKVKEYHVRGIHVVSTDEKPGMQALERDGKSLPVKEGKVARREFNYRRHGTRVLTANLDLATGLLVSPTIDKTRTEKDFVRHVENTVNTDPDAPWIFLADNLNTHVSASLVFYVAKVTGDTRDLGVKGKSGILESMKTRREYLSDPSHRIYFVYTPKHCSWLNPIEVWLGILSGHVLNLGNFTSAMDMVTKVLNYIAYYNKNWAKPWKWSIVTNKDIQALIKKVKQIELELASPVLA